MAVTDLEVVGIVKPDAIDLPPSIVARMAEVLPQVQVIGACLQGFLEGRGEADRPWRLEVTGARLVAVDPPT